MLVAVFGWSFLGFSRPIIILGLRLCCCCCCYCCRGFLGCSVKCIYLGKILVTLVDESGHEFHVKYYADKTGLGAGWRQFCCTHNLLEGDVLVFQLVEPAKLKIYIMRANDLNELDGALGFLNLDAHTKQSDAETGPTASESTKRKRPKSLSFCSKEE